jgi:hypothetical protein
VGGFAAVAAFAFLWSFLAGAKQWLGDDGFGLVRPFAGFLAHGISSCRLACAYAGGEDYAPLYRKCPRLGIEAHAILLSGSSSDKCHFHGVMMAYGFMAGG